MENAAAILHRKCMPKEVKVVANLWDDSCVICYMYRQWKCAYKIADYSPTIRYISILKIVWISVFNPNSGKWIRSGGFALFIYRRPFFSGAMFDIKPGYAIGCMYKFCICNNFIDFDSFDSLNLSQPGVKLVYWQEKSWFSRR